MRPLPTEIREAALLTEQGFWLLKFTKAIGQQKEEVMRRLGLILAVLTMLGGVLVASPVVRADDQIYCGPNCQGWCPYGGGCIYDIQHDSCYIFCNPPPPPDPKPLPWRPGCYYDQGCGCMLCDASGVARIPHLTLHLDKAPLETALEQVATKAEIPIVAPSLKQGTVSLGIENARLEFVLSEIAKQVDAVPVVRGTLHSIELVPKGELAERTFSPPPSGPADDLSMDFQDVDSVIAIKMVAEAARIDIVLPSSLADRTTGSHVHASWRDLLQQIVGSKAKDARLSVTSNGLVQLEP